MRWNRTVLLSGHDFTPEEGDLKFKFFMMNSIILLSAGLVAVLTVASFVSVPSANLSFNVAYIAMALLAFWLLRRGKQYHKPVSIAIVTVGLLVLYITLWLNPEEPLRITWLLMIIAFAFFIEGRRAGYVLTAVSTGMILSLYLLSYPSLDLYAVLLILILTGLLIFVIEMYERRVAQAQKALEMTNRELENQVQHEIRRRLALMTQTNQELKDLADALAEQKNDYKKLAHYDPLTGLPNRTRFFDYCTRAVERADREGRPLALLFMDLDNFKQINDSLGHAAGDDVLRQIGERLQYPLKGVRMLARFGGDEFIVLFEHFSGRRMLEETVRELAQRLNQPVVIQEREIHITFSMGVALYPEDGTQVSELLKYADAAMYSAKETGPDRLRFYSRELTRQSIERLTLESRLQRGLDREQFELYYQPQISLETGAIVSVEALVRWNSPQKGLLEPDAFIPAAEEGILIHRLGKVILEHAAMQMSQWEDQGIAPSRMAVNVSVVQLQDPALISAIRSALERCSLSGWLELEITESFTFHDPGEAIGLLKAIRELGVGLAVDDFGKGYSALSHLKDLPVDRLKIDRAFVKDILIDERDEALVRAIVAMAEGMDLGVVAEGIEETGQLELLKKIGCQEGQGYLIGRPMNAEAIAPLLRQGRIEVA